MRILIIDKNSIVRAGMNLLLKEIGGRIFFDDAAGLSDSLKMIQNNEYDVVLVGLSLPDLEGFEILGEIRRNKPSQRTIVVGMHTDERLAVKAYMLGADGFVEVANTADDLIKAIKKVVSGGRFASERVMEAVLGELQSITANNQDPHRLKQLSGREKQIASLLATGVTNKEIAWQLAINVKTVSTYKTRILTKLNLKNLAELVKYQLSYA
jgi:two-component system invasion response regulator UvrY